MGRIDFIRFRRDTAAAWTAANPILGPGEPGFEIDTGKLKIGDGSTPWNTLDYLTDGGGASTASTMPSIFPNDGEDGQPGVPGRQGVDGAAGTAGADGAAGAQGPPGFPGDDGDPGFMAIPGAAGAGGAAGTAGADGAAGQQGPPGLPGEDGDPGFMAIPGAAGAAGTPGATTLVVQETDVTVVATADTLDFEGTFIDVGVAGNEANISLDYAALVAFGGP